MSGSMNGGARISSGLGPEFSARVLREVPMSRHTSWHVGGRRSFSSRRAM